jgi:hypothetical protein
MPSISPSKYSTLRTCPRLFFYEQVRYYERARETGARAFGSLFHLGLEAWWKHAGDGDMPWTDEALVHALCAIQNGAKHAATDPYDLAKAEAMMLVYHGKYHALEFERVGEGGGVEEAFRVQLVDPDGHEVPGWTLIGKKDALVKMAKHPTITPIEHKTTGSDITGGSDYWQRLAVDGQVSIYVDATNALGFECDSVFWDACRKPDISPERATPEDKRTMTQGKGCKLCGGSAGGKKIEKGSGIAKFTRGKKGFPKNAPDDIPDGVDEVEVQCPDCSGSGWKEEPRLSAKVRLEDEKPEDYKFRVIDKLAENPEQYFKQCTVPRTAPQIAEARHDLVEATVEIDNYYARARKATNGNLDDPKARFSFPRNTNACLNIYGRRCDFLEVCSGQVTDPLASNLYRIKDKKKAGTK